jgi:RHS repeat-associated protein
MIFDAEYRDASTGNDNLRARIYDPGLGSFPQTDPVSTEPSYAFAAGNPVMNADPTGLSPIGDTLWEMVHNPVASWQEGPTAPKVIGGAMMLASGGFLGCVAVSAACAAVGVASIGPGFLAEASANLAAVRACVEVCDDTANLVEDVLPITSAESEVLQGFTKHGIDQVISRGVRPYEILEALRSGVTKPGWGDVTKYLGPSAQIRINSLGQVVTAIRYKAIGDP